MRKLYLGLGMSVVAVALVVGLFFALGPLVAEEPASTGEDVVAVEETPVEEDACQGYEQVGSFCVSPEGDVYAPGDEGKCVDGTTFGYCPDLDGKVSSPNDKLPEDVCRDGTYRVPCYPQEKPPHPLEKQQYVQKN